MKGVNTLALSAVMCLFAVTGAYGEAIYAVQGDGLYSADTGTGEWVELSGSWEGTELITSFSRSLYAIQGDVLYRVARDGTWAELSDSWTGTVGLTAGDNWLYAVQNDLLYRIDPDNGSWESIPGSYDGTTVHSL